jgi:Flp pilus assembly pilin Flp
MSAFLLLNAVRVQAAGAVHRLAERITDDERGQDTIEYIGVLLVVAALIFVVLGVVKSDLTTTISKGATSLINKVFAGNG